MTRPFIIIPVKPLEEGKSRLASVLRAGERRRLNGFLMDRSFEHAAAVVGASRTIVVSRSIAVLAAAKARGMASVAEEADDLNLALSQATREALALGATGVMILPVDLPLAGSDDFRRILGRCSEELTCVIVSDRRGQGTNLLCMSPACEDIYRFGPDSLQHHRAAALERHYRVIELSDKTLGFDVDDPSDYRLWQQMNARRRASVDLALTHARKA